MTPREYASIISRLDTHTDLLNYIVWFLSPETNREELKKFGINIGDFSQKPEMVENKPEVGLEGGQTL